MRQFNIRKAKAQLSNLVKIVNAGEEVIIAKAGTPMVRQVPMLSPPSPRKKGLLGGRIKIGPKFDEPLCDAVSLPRFKDGAGYERNGVSSHLDVE